ncbi:MAG: DUF4397 domain-containing protein, partial [Chloroflexales bacterium]|nr:DUF4397 domain-containing protein [Chloroflexales bacterium]
ALLLALSVQSSFAAPAPASVRFVHASPDTPAVDVFIDGALVLSNVKYFAASSSLSVPAGQHTLQVAPTGQGRDEAVVNDTIDLIRGRAYTLAATGKLENIKALALLDEQPKNLNGKAWVRVINATVGAPAIDVRLANAEAPLLTDQGFRTVDYLRVDPATYTFEVAPAGTDQAFAISSPLRFEPGWNYTVITTGLYNTSGVGIQAIVDRTAP